MFQATFRFVFFEKEMINPVKFRENDYLCSEENIRYNIIMKYLISIVICCFHLLSALASHPLEMVTLPTVAADSVRELPLPSVPTTLRQPAERANYIISHFWDAMDFRDTLHSHNKGFMEQNFANFISVFPYADERAQRTAVEILLDKAEADSAAYVLVRDIAEKYLYESNSPMMSEDYYILFLERFVHSTILGEYATLRLCRQLDAARKNRPGMIAADFTYITRDGSSTTLHKTPTQGNMLLIFYDPDCEHCKEIMGELQVNETLANAIAFGKITVLAIYSGDDHDLWKHTATSLPTDWTVGYEAGILQENGAYVLRTMPTLYLLDSHKKVIQKDVLPIQLLYLLQNSN